MSQINPGSLYRCVGKGLGVALRVRAVKSKRVWTAPSFAPPPGCTSRPQPSAPAPAPRRAGRVLSRVRRVVLVLVLVLAQGEAFGSVVDAFNFLDVLGEGLGC